uniref:Uncharacterized protein n=1 Tax=Fagus sylvatica TaxID=28930 RepID=A0A2N9GQG5_FAGSY
MVMAENDQTNKELGGLNSKSPWKTPVAATDGDVPSPSPVMMGAPPESWPALTDAAASKPLVAPQPSPPFLQVATSDPMSMWTQLAQAKSLKYGMMVGGKSISSLGLTCAAVYAL